MRNLKNQLFSFLKYEKIITDLVNSQEQVRKFIEKHKTEKAKFKNFSYFHVVLENDSKGHFETSRYLPFGDFEKRRSSNR